LLSSRARPASCASKGKRLGRMRDECMQPANDIAMQFQEMREEGSLGGVAGPCTKILR